MVERPLCMREVPGSIPGFSKIGIIFWSFLCFSQFFFPHLFARQIQIVFHDFCITAILLSAITTQTKVLVFHSLSPATEDDHLGVSNDSGNMNFPKKG